MSDVVTGSANKRQYLWSILIVLLVSGICLSLSAFISYRMVSLILLFTVSTIAATFAIGPVIVASVLCATIWDFLFIPPRFAFHVHTTEDSILLMMFFIIGLLNGVFTYRLRRIEKTTRLKEERANSVKLYNTILNSLSHELRTPIATIIGASDNLLLNENLTSDNREQLLQEISKSSLRLNQQVENLLNISRLESGHIQPKSDWCDVTELIYEVVSRIEDNHSHRKISISINPDMPYCSVDKGMLDQVLYNLINNAAIHTAANTIIQVSALYHINVLEIIVEDNGTGFSAKEMKDVFDKFSRDKARKNSGRGLGLSIVKGFTEAMGGSVDLIRGSLGGAKFTLTLPVRTSSIAMENE